ncbi:MAG: type II toxin-antitoxin system VapC family toxin, partial [Ktedonobacterales bacterium]
CKPSRGHWLYLSESALVEVTATLCRMVRENPPRLTLATRERLLALFQGHVQNSYHIIPTSRDRYVHAADLCRSHPLRAYDAVQLACALAARDDALSAGLTPPTFVCADAVLLGVAAAEGLAVENPNDH